MTKFRNLPVGATFDFIHDESRLNSFYLRCEKISARQYKDENGLVYSVGSINANVYHVNSKG